MKALLVIAVIVVITGILGFGSMTVSADDNNESNCAQILNETAVTASTDTVLTRYEHSDRPFTKIVFSDGDVVYGYIRMIGDVEVEGDFINYQVRNGVLVGNFTHWRDGLPSEPPNITITQSEALSTAGGGEATLYYISPNSSIFYTVEPVPTEPCWVVCKRDGNNTLYNLTVVDAQNGTILGYGVPPPAESFLYAGPEDTENCTDTWYAHFNSALYWFNAMGYSNSSLVYPTNQDLKSYIQSSDTAVIYGVAHGTNSVIYCGCTQEYTAMDVKDWLSGYPPLKFTFLASCEAMLYADSPDTFGYEFRKGATNGSVVVGFVGMGQAPMGAWSYSCDWQNTFFNCLAGGWTIGSAFSQANKVYYMCANNTAFAGDAQLKLVPKVCRCDVKTAIKGKVYDVNSNLLSNVNIAIYKGTNSSPEATTKSNPNYCVVVSSTGPYWLSASNISYLTLDTNKLPQRRNPNYPDHITGLLGSPYIFNFEGDYGLVPKACTMGYALQSTNRWLFIPMDSNGCYHPEWQLSNWKAMESVHSWIYPS